MGLRKKIFSSLVALPLVFSQPVFSQLKKDSLAFAPNFENNFGKKKKYVLVIDAGHGLGNREVGKMDFGDAKYVVKDSTYHESDLVLEQAKRLKELLNPEKYEVYLTREDDKYPTPLEFRPYVAREVNADLFISLHLNNHDTKKDIHGYEIFWRENRSKYFAKLLKKNFDKLPHAKKRRFTRKNFLMLKDLGTVGVLLESGYLEHPNDREYLFSKDNEGNSVLNEKLYVERAILKSIEQYFAKPRKTK